MCLPLLAQELGRCMDAAEMLCSLGLPVTAGQAKRCSGKVLKMTGVPKRQLQKMAGNAMSVPVIGAVVLACVICLSRKEEA